jgi:hypothetical protein
MDLGTPPKLGGETFAAHFQMGKNSVIGKFPLKKLLNDFANDILSNTSR